RSLRQRTFRLRRRPGLLPLSRPPSLELPVQRLRVGPGDPLLPRAAERLSGVCVESEMHPQPGSATAQPLGTRSAAGANAATRGRATPEDEAAQDAVGASVWHNQAREGGRLLSDAWLGEGACRDESDRAGLQPQTRDQPDRSPETTTRAELNPASRQNFCNR